jgi:hypothetical protein
MNRIVANERKRDFISQEIETKQTGISVDTDTSCTLIREENTDVV